MAADQKQPRKQADQERLSQDELDRVSGGLARPAEPVGKPVEPVNGTKVDPING